ncbi:MAG: hypothetical protein IT320_06415 [Anaerolineae bacterium]|nr:hypothetical protein [Anaerolineae bacterium]
MLYDPLSEESIMSLAEWMRLVRVGLWRNRLQPDYLARVGEYRAEFLATVHEMGKTGPFWQV